MRLFGKASVCCVRPGVVVLSFVLALFIAGKYAGVVVKSRLQSVDTSCTFEDVEFGFNSLCLRNLRMPGLGITARRVFVITGGSVFKPVPLHVVLCDVVVEPPAEDNSTDGSSVPDYLPVISVIDGSIPEYSTVFYGTRMSGSNLGYASGLWGEAFVDLSRDSVSAAFVRCSGLPGIQDAVPDIMKGHSVSGRCSGVIRPAPDLTGVITGVDGEPASAAFSYSVISGEPQAVVTMEFSQLAQPAMLFLDSISSGSVLSMVPSGSLSVGVSGGDSVLFKTALRFDSLCFWNPSVAPDTFSTDIVLECSGFVLPGQNYLCVDSGSVFIHTLRLNFSLFYSWGDRRKLRLTVCNPSLAGESISASIPSELLGDLNGLALEGELSFSTDLSLDWDYPDSCDISFDVDASDLAVGYSPIVFGRISNRGGAVCLMRDSWGNTSRVGLDRSSNPAFVPFDSLPVGFEPLLRCAEDASFRRHNGFSQYHITNSIRADMAQGQFVRGGSTITMQLAKNLFLGREKTLARKLQEVFLTWRLERWLSKDRILEIYANIVELGPGVFGFNSAARYYFDHSASDLSVRETAFLVSILPGPKLYHRYAVQGVLPSYWKSYIERLITICGTRGWLEESVVSDALADTLIFDGAVSLL